MKKIYTTLFLIGFVFLSEAGNEDYPVGGRSSAMGNASVSLADVWSAHHNQAGLGFEKNISAGVYYENRFLLKELGVKGAVIALPEKGGTFGLCVTNFGYSLYSEKK